MGFEVIVGVACSSVLLETEGLDVDALLLVLVPLVFTSGEGY
jgi:hypothetical protein